MAKGGMPDSCRFAAIVFEFASHARDHAGAVGIAILRPVGIVARRSLDLTARTGH